MKNQIFTRRLSDVDSLVPGKNRKFVTNTKSYSKNS